MCRAQLTVVWAPAAFSVSETAKQRQPVLCIAVTTVEHEVVVAEHVTHHVHFRLISERCCAGQSAAFPSRLTGQFLHLAAACWCCCSRPAARATWTLHVCLLLEEILLVTSALLGWIFDRCCSAGSTASSLSRLPHGLDRRSMLQWPAVRAPPPPPCRSPSGPRPRHVDYVGPRQVDSRSTSG